ncbi:MAG: hypothetical protein EOP45_09235 [Sphingobacteriaceae bacterium]|nr:MAG: hypothetical protein EOP45_09235 [Sphingobacteriaceae bacterium]
MRRYITEKNELTGNIESLDQQTQEYRNKINVMEAKRLQQIELKAQIEQSLERIHQEGKSQIELVNQLIYSAT